MLSSIGKGKNVVPEQLNIIGTTKTSPLLNQASQKEGSSSQMQKRLPSTSIGNNKSSNNNVGNTTSSKSAKVFLAETEKQSFAQEQGASAEEDFGFGIQVKKIVSRPKEKNSAAAPSRGAGIKAQNRLVNSSSEGERLKKLSTREKSQEAGSRAQHQIPQKINNDGRKGRALSRERQDNIEISSKEEPANLLKKASDPVIKTMRKALKATESSGSSKNIEIKKKPPALIAQKSASDKPPLAEKKKPTLLIKEEKYNERPGPQLAQPLLETKDIMENHSTIEDYRFQIDESQSDFDQFNIEDYMKKSQRLD